MAFASSRSLRILLSAYACEPNVGSEMAKGWQVAMELARLGHEVTVLTCGSHHRAGIERWRAQGGRLPANLTFAWFDLQDWSGPGYVGTRWLRLHYLRWQLAARREVRRLHAERHFDVVHHASWTVLRWPSFLGGIAPRTVFGPVGGGERTPWRLRRGFPLRAVAEEAVRDLLNLWARIDPLVHIGCSGMDAILVTDEATRRSVPGQHRDRAVIWPDIYSPDCAQVAGSRRPRAPGTPLRAIVVARLEYWKGVHFAIGALAILKAHGVVVELTVAGRGRHQGRFMALAQMLGVTAQITWVGQVPHQVMPSLLARHDVMLFPSLHDSAGQAIGEALAVGLPVICLDRGGPAAVIDDSCGFRVPTRARWAAQVEQDIAEHLAGLAADADLLRRLGEGAIAKSSKLSFQSSVGALIERFYAARPLPHPPVLALDDAPPSPAAS